MVWVVLPVGVAVIRAWVPVLGLTLSAPVWSWVAITT